MDYEHDSATEEAQTKKVEHGIAGGDMFDVHKTLQDTSPPQKLQLDTIWRPHWHATTHVQEALPDNTDQET